MPASNPQNPVGRDLALPASELRQVCDPAALNFTSTAEIEIVDELVGQKRALSAIDFGTRIDHDGFNIFALGPTRSGRHGAIHKFLEHKAATEPVPDDWIYVNNFAAPDRPKAIRLPSGIGLRLKASMQELIDDLSAALPATFESEDYRNRRKAIDDDFEATQEKAFDELRAKGQKQNIGILRTPMGFALAPLSGGQVVKPEVFNALLEAERKAIESKIMALQEDLERILKNLPVLERERRRKIRSLNAEIAEMVVGLSISEIAARFAGNDDIKSYLSDVRSDLIDNAELFLRPHQEEEAGPFDAFRQNGLRHPAFARYAVNVLVSHCAEKAEAAARGAPVISEEHPTLGKVLGHIDHRSLMGALVTDFTMIKAGALHRANGGYLVLDARRVLTEPFVWEALKRCLRNKKIEFSSVADELSLVSTVSLTPDSIPLSVKVILVGERLLYYLLASLDPEFDNLFKVQADFEDVTERSADSVALFARLMGSIARQESLLPLSAAAVARLIEQAAREAEDAERLTLRVGILADIIRESHYWATAGKRDRIDVEDVDRALDERRYRSERIRDRSLETITRNITLVDTDGVEVGQINGLSVLRIGNLSFGRPTRITARVRMGSGKVVDIEREVELGGPLHSKGVLILSSFLATRYALPVPMSLWASLVFEQSYGGVEGDSASSAELYALLSALADSPINQSLAVTGSVNQLGQIQAIGGVNEKIEGFFDICKARGLTGRQGVVIPRANCKHLMLRQDIVAAASQDQFRIYAVSTIDEGIELLTGLPAGNRGPDGRFADGSVNARVEAKLMQFAEMRRSFGRSGAEASLESKEQV
ncbi:MAG: AAA family ATPase [Rhizobiales bacterium]|nr:AAA family ATPase [Hyphomicrobiales bacterium]